MDVLENYKGDTSPQINIDEMYGVEKKRKPLSDATARNEAALMSLLHAEPSKITETYQNLYNELLQGGTEYSDMVGRDLENKASKGISDTLVGILGDASLPLDVKKSAVEAAKTYSPSKVDMFSQKVASEDQEGNAEQAYMLERSRNVLAKENDFRAQRQAIHNAHQASKDSSFTGFLVDLVEAALPTFFQTAGTLTEVQKSLGMKPSVVDRLYLKGAKEKIREHLFKLPPEQRAQAVETIANAIDENSGVLIYKKNDLAARELLSQLIGDGYSGSDAAVDNAVQLLDAIGVGQLTRSVSKGVVRGFSKRIVDTPTAPASPLDIAASSNPAEARKLYEAANVSDESSLAISGTDKTSLILDNELPQLLSESVPNKLVDPARRVSKELKETVLGKGGIRFTQKERDEALEKAKTEYLNATGVNLLDNYTQFGIQGDKVVVKGFYGSSEGGFLKAEDALEQARYTFRSFEIGDDSLSIHKLSDEGEYVPVKLEDVKGVEGNYIVGLEIKRGIDVSDTLDVKYNFADRFKFSNSRITGSVSSNILDHASMLHPVITGSAERAVDLGTRIDKLIIQIGDDYARQARSLDKAQREQLAKVIHDSNFNRVEYDDSTLRTTYGLNDRAIDALKKWREGWDSHHWLSNLTHVKNMRNSGYQVLVSPNAKLYGKPVSKGSATGEVYDATTDTIKLLSSNELDSLYNKGGTLVKLRTPETILGKEVTHFAVDNSPSTYLRTLNDSDQVLNYIPGYYKLYYNSPRFVVEKVKGSNGSTYERAIAVAGDWKEAEHYLKRKAAAAGVTPEQFGRIRGDIKQYSLGDDMDWELGRAAGVVNQRHRGKLLADASSPTVHLGSTNYVVDPMESFIRSASNISARVALQDEIDVMKKRLMTQYKNVMPEKGEYPSSYLDIGKKGDEFSKEAADARTLWGYIDKLENGYINAIDAASKDIFRAMGDVVGKKGLSGAERGLMFLSRQNFMQDANNLVYQSLIKFNPLRQWIVQPIQALQLWAYDPISFVKSMDAFSNWMTASIAKKAGAPLTKKQKEIYDFMEKWGGLDGVDRQNLVDGPLRDMSRSSNKALRAIGKASDIPAKVGFDPAERTNLALHVLTERERAIRQGKDIDDVNVIDEVFAKARALTLSMNRAGDMPYNRTAISILTRFLQIPHKSFTKITYNRRLSKSEKARIAVGDLLLYGVPIATFGEVIGKDVLSDDPVMREAQMFGLFTAGYNRIWRDFLGVENMEANLSSMSPYETQGWNDLAVAFWESGIAGMIGSTPAGELFVGNNPRVTEAFKRMSRWMNINNYEGAPEDFSSVVSGFASITSGWSNYLKYRYITNTEIQMNKNGVVLKEGVSNAEALHVLFGIQSMSESARFDYLSKMNKKQKAKEEEIKSAVKDIVQAYTRIFQSPISEQEQFIRILQEMNRVFSDNSKDLELAHKEFIRLARDRDSGVVSGFLRFAGILSFEEHKQMLKASGMPEEQIQKFIEILRYANEGDDKVNEVFDKEGM